MSSTDTNTPAASASSVQECSICFEEMTAATGHATLGCAHRFHLMCIVRWFQEQEDDSSCPFCRHTVGVYDNLPAAPEEADEEDDNEEEEWLTDDEEDEEDEDEDDADSVGSLRRVWTRDPVGGQWEGRWLLEHPTVTVWDPRDPEDVREPPEELTDVVTEIQRIWRGHRVRRGPLAVPAPDMADAVQALLKLSESERAASWIMDRMLRVD
jgi:hypothetical protein